MRNIVSIVTPIVIIVSIIILMPAFIITITTITVIEAIPEEQRFARELGLVCPVLELDYRF